MIDGLQYLLDDINIADSKPELMWTFCIFGKSLSLKYVIDINKL
ncbi:MAG: hypothetical protein K0Q73_3117 [Paenibacillus sp.]|jgi:lipid-A-disaccharide synthase-like uncharacterized protein|nr:hypothetical protein [Paenibacillus sp.]